MIEAFGAFVGEGRASKLDLDEFAEIGRVFHQGMGVARMCIYICRHKIVQEPPNHPPGNNLIIFVPHSRARQVRSSEPPMP